jgi:hypothetical protein
MLELMAQLVQSHRGLVELVAALQDDVLDLVESTGRSPAELREDAQALRGEAAQAAQQAQRLIAEAQSLAGRAGELRGRDGAA